MERVFMKGCEAMAEAAVRAGCRFFAGYPITPQNEIPALPLRPRLTYEWEEAAAMYVSWKQDARAEEYFLEDAEVVITAYGISGRIAKSAVNLLRKTGVKAGLLRPLTVNPFPEQAYDHIDYSRVKAVLDVEMSIPAQFVKDVETAVRGRCPIKTCLCSGGNIMSREAVMAAARKIVEGA